jgi:hypothetical protein
LRKQSFLSVCVTILITCIVCSSGFFFQILAKSHVVYLNTTTTPHQISKEFQPIKKIVNFSSGPIQVKRQGQPCQDYKDGQTALPLCVCCAHVPTQPSAEVNFALRKQVSVSVSSVVTPVVFSSGVLFLTPVMWNESFHPLLVQSNT